MSEISFFQSSVMLLLVGSSIRVNKQHTLGKMSWNSNTCKTKLWTWVMEKTHNQSSRNLSLPSFRAVVQDSLTCCSQKLYRTYNYHKQQGESAILFLSWKPLSQHFIVSRHSLTVKVRCVVWAHFCCTVHWSTTSNNVQEEGGPGVSRTVNHTYFFIQISTIRLLLKFNLLD